MRACESTRGPHKMRGKRRRNGNSKGKRYDNVNVKRSVKRKESSVSEKKEMRRSGGRKREERRAKNANARGNGNGNGLLGKRQESVKRRRV